jgi:ankyrin repeat protein
VDSLVAGGAEVDAIDINLSTALHLVSEIGNDYVVDILVDDNANLEALDVHGRTPLHVACTEGKGYCVDLLIANGAEVNTFDGKGLSPLHLAVLNGQIEIVKAPSRRRRGGQCGRGGQRSPLPQCSTSQHQRPSTKNLHACCCRTWRCRSL